MYRHLRRRENTRQQCIQDAAEKESLEDEFQMKLAANRKVDEEKTEKKRAKRCKKLQLGDILECECGVYRFFVFVFW